MPTVSFQAPTDYGAEAEAIQRRRAYAELLQKQGMEVPGNTEVVGGWAIPRSPMEGLGKVAQQASGIYQQNKLDEKQKELAKQYQLDLADTFKRATEAGTGKPEQAAQAPTTPMDDEGNAMPGVAAQPAVAPNPQAMASILMQHPGTQALGMSTAATEIANQQRAAKLAEIMKMVGQPQGAGTTPGPQGAAPAQPGPTLSPQPAANPFAGVPPAIVALMNSGDPELAATGKALLEASKGIAQRAGAPVVNPFTGAVIAQPTPSVPPGVQLNVGPGGPVASPIPGAMPAMAGVTQSQAAAGEAGKAPYQLHTLNTEGAPTVMTGQQAIEAATRQPMPRPGQPAPANFPRESPQQNVNAGQVQLQALNAEAQQFTNAGARVPPELQHAIDAATKRAGGGYPGAGKPAQGLPGLRLQDQGESAEQRKFGEETAQLRVSAPIDRAAVADASNNLTRAETMTREIMNSPALKGITGLRGALPNMPGSDAADLDAKLNSLKSQVGFSVLQAMRDASKTGGALGAISDRENELLQRNLAALDKSQSPEGMKKSLQQLVDYFQGARERITRAYSDKYERVVGTQGMLPTERGAVPAAAGVVPLNIQPDRRAAPRSGNRIVVDY